MKFLLKIILLNLCLGATVCNKATYKAAVVSGNLRNGFKDYVSQISDASKQKADIVLLTSGVSDVENVTDTDCHPDEYDKLVLDISAAAKKFGMYIATHLYEKVLCLGREEMIRNNLVFDRKGEIVSIYSKPLNHYASCNMTFTALTAFTSDFGVNFLVVMNEDIVLQDLGSLKGTNFIVTGGSAEDMAYLKGNQLISSWAYVLKANVISDEGIFTGEAGFNNGNGRVVQINTNGGDKLKTLSFNPIDLRDLPAEDTRQHIIRPLDLEASSRGYKESVCHGEFCCEFYVKTKTADLRVNEAHYGLSVFAGERRMGGHNIGVESCKLVVCAALYKRTCVLGLENMNVAFEKMSIRGNFTHRHSTQFPVILTTQTSLPSDNLAFATKPVGHVQEASIMLSDVKNVMKFGILSRDFSRDYPDFISHENTTKSYLFNEEVIEFFDYLWIRVRVLILIVSIYILEMM